MSNNSESPWPEHWPAWVTASCDKLAATEKAADNFLPDDAPEWAFRILVELLKLTYPKLDLKSLDQSGPAALGSFCGHHQWLDESEYGIESQLERLEKTLEHLDDFLRRKLSKQKYAKLIAEGEKYGADVEFYLDAIDTTLAEKKKRVQSIITLAGKQELSEKADFMAAYSEALQTPTFDELGDPTREKFPGTSRVYTLMVLFWRHVDTLPTMKALHDWLCRLLGESAIGPYDNGRVKGICKRFKIRLAPRGRPRKKRY